MLVPVNPGRLQVIPDAWTDLAPYAPGETGEPGELIRVRLRDGELIIPVTKARQLCGRYAPMPSRAEDIAELIRQLGTLDPARPAGQDAYGNSYYAVIPPVAVGNSYRFASGGIVVQ